MNNKSITVQNLSKTFGDFKAVDNVSFDVNQGEIFGFLGANGAGKSTTIRMLCGILQPSGGKGVVAGYDISTNARDVRQNIGYMSQKFSLYDELTVYENMRFFAKLYSVPNDIFNERLKETVEKVNLSGYENTKTISLSAGIKQRLSLACAIIHNPKILFLDEPTSGVDPISRRKFWDLIYSFASSGVTIFVTTHYMDEAEYCDRIAMITAGKLQEIGTPEELKTSKMRLDVISITSEDLYKVATVLKDAKNIFDVGVLSHSVRILSKGLTTDEVKQMLDKYNTHYDKIEHAQASLEDVFVSLSGVDV